MPKLIWVFAGRTCNFVGFVIRRLIYPIWFDYDPVKINLLILSQVGTWNQKSIISIRNHLTVIPSDGIFNSHRTTIFDSFSCIFFLWQLHLYALFYQYLYAEISTFSVKKCLVRLLPTTVMLNFWQKITWKFLSDMQDMRFLHFPQFLPVPTNLILHTVIRPMG